MTRLFFLGISSLLAFLGKVRRIVRVELIRADGCLEAETGRSALFPPGPALSSIPFFFFFFPRSASGSSAWVQRDVQQLPEEGAAGR